MAVNISIDLNTTKAHAKIAELKTALESIDEDLDTDLDDLDFDGVLDDLDDVSEKMEEIRLQTRQIGDDLDTSLAEFEGLEVDLRPDQPEGQTGAIGGEGDPPNVEAAIPDGDAQATDGGGDGLSPRQFTQRMDSLFGTRKGLFMGDSNFLDPSDRDTFDEGSPYRDARGRFTSVERVFDAGEMQKRIGMKPDGPTRHKKTGQFVRGHVDPLKDPRRLGDEEGFGIEPVSMTGPDGRRRSFLQGDELQEIRDMDLGFDIENEARIDSEFGESASIKSPLDYSDREIQTAVEIDPELDFDSEFGEGATERLRSRLQDVVIEDIDLEGDVDTDAVENVKEQIGDFDGGGRRKSRFGFLDDIDIDFPSFGDDDGFLEGIKRRSDAMDDANTRINRFGNALKRLKPTMRKWWSLLAAIIPLIITFGVQALGVAAALGGVAAAGAAVIGLGLAGHAENMGEAWSEAKERLSNLKEELFEVFQPTMRQFAPISEEFLNRAPAELEKVSEALEGLTAFEGVILDGLLVGLTDWIADAIDGMTSAEDTITQLAMRFGNILGTEIIEFFGWLLRETSANQQMLIKLGAALANVGLIIYNLSKAFSHVFTILGPVFDILAGLSGLLNNDLVLAITSFTLVTYGLAAALSKLGLSAMVALSKLGILGSGTFLGSVMGGLAALHAQVTGLIVEYTALAGAAASAAAAIALTGVGAIAVLGGAAVAGNVLADNPGATGGYTGDTRGVPATAGNSGGTVVNNYNRYEVTHKGEMTNDSEQRLRSTIRDVQNEDAAKSVPNPETDSSVSTVDGDSN